MAGVQKNHIGSLTADAVGGFRDFAKGWLRDTSNTLLRVLWQIAGISALLPVIAAILYLVNVVDVLTTLGLIVGAPLAASLALFLALWLRASMTSEAAPGDRPRAIA